MTSRITHLDGLKGLGIISVVFLHYADGFYPSLQEPSEHILHKLIAESPVRLVYNGFFFVYVFFLLSGYILGYSYFHRKRSYSLIPSILKRYLRLLPVVCITTIAAYLLLRFDLMRNHDLTPITHGYLQYYYQQVPDALSMLHEIFIGTFFKGANHYNIPVWFLTTEMIGSSIIFCFLYFFGHTRLRYPLYLLLVIPAYKFHYMHFLFGVLLSDLQHSHTHVFEKFRNAAFLLPVLLIGIILGSYPLAEHITSAEGNLFHLMTIGDYVTSADLYWTIASLCLLICALYLDPVRQFLSLPFLTFCGRLSLPICATHFILACSFSAFIFLKVFPVLSYHGAAITMFVVSMPCILGISYLLHRYIEIPGIRFSEFVYTMTSKLSYKR